mmetsp:Transcript_16314/g.36797  ORF Transcript_16314/g.36797 Transcript_16314/m.36797 type:complete len:98 (+) Transcript_16314:3-296(+)
MIYAGCAGRFRMVGPKKISGQVRHKTAAEEEALQEEVEVIETPATVDAVEEPPEDDPASTEYRNMFAAMQQIHDSWQGPGSSGAGVTDLGLSAQEVC